MTDIIEKIENSSFKSIKTISIQMQISELSNNIASRERSVKVGTILHFVSTKNSPKIAL